MLSITIGSTQIPVDPGISLQTVLKSPLFATSDSRIPGSYIFNTSFPATTELRKEFGNAHRLGKNARASAELPYVIQLGILKYVGTCVVKYASPESYDIAFKIDTGDFAGIISSKTLKDLNLGGDINFADIYSRAHLSEYFIFSGTDEFYWELLIPYMLDIIDTDFTTSFTNNGYIFTAPMDALVHQVMNFNIQVFYGTLTITIKNGNTVLFTHVLTDSSLTEIKHDLNLIENETIEVTFLGASNSQGVANIRVNSFELLYTTDNLFTTMALSLDTQDVYDFTVFPVHNALFLSNFPEDAFILDNLSIKTLYGEYFKTLNYWKKGEFPMFMSGVIEGENISAANLFTPFVYMNRLLKGIVEEAGYTLINSPFEVDGEYKDAVLFNAYSENTYTSEDTKLVPVKLSFNLSDHLPILKQSDFIAWISMATGYMPIISNKELTITFVKIKTLNVAGPSNATIAFPGILLEKPKVTIEPEYKGIKLELKKAATDSFLSSRIQDIESKMVYKGSVAALGNLPSTGNLVNDYYLVTDANAFYVWQYNETTYTLTWCFFTRDWPLIYTEGEEPYLEISTEFSPVLTAEMLDETPGAPADRLWIIPQTEQPGILEGFPDSLGAEYGIQMLFYKGMSLDSNNETYPLGTTRLEDYSGNAYFTNFNARNVFNLQYKEFLQWLAYDAKPVTVRAVMDSKALAALKYEKIYRYKGISFLIKEIRVNLLHDSLSIAELDIYTC